MERNVMRPSAIEPRLAGPGVPAASSASFLLTAPWTGESSWKRSNRSRSCGKVLISSSVARPRIDRKSTRLNSSHGSISYAVFCLKKKKKKKNLLKLYNTKTDEAYQCVQGQ